MASSSTVSEARSALLNAVAATDSLIELERDGEQRARALAGREAMVDLCDQLSLLEDNAIMAEVALRVPPAISWLPQALQASCPLKLRWAKPSSRRPGFQATMHLDLAMLT